jgi:CDGSH-type Zn-finger protein
MADRTVKVRKNGLYLTPGPARIIDEPGTTIPLDQEIIALCRCGGSHRKPFCDGTHRTIGFEGAEGALQMGKSG